MFLFHYFKKFIPIIVPLCFSSISLSAFVSIVLEDIDQICFRVKFFREQSE